MVRRATARAGDAVFVSGTHRRRGARAWRLRRNPRLRRNWGLSAAEAEHLRRRYRAARAAAGPGAALRAMRSAAMDMSDGLVKDLDAHVRGQRRAPGARAADVPLSAPAPQGPGGRPERSSSASLAGGDDYEMLASRRRRQGE